MIEAVATHKKGRRLAGVLAGALALGVIPFALPASAQTDPLPTQLNSRVTACPADPDTGTITSTEVPDAGFTDVTDDNVHEFAIDCVAWYQITSGKTATTYDPAGTVRRDQLATFIAQMIDYVTDRTDVGGLPAAPDGNAFPCDLDTANVHFENIQRLAEADVVTGSGSSSAGACFDPDGTVTRAQMATFIREASRVAGETLLSAGDDNYFVDDDDSVHHANINAIALAGIAAGAGKDANNDNIYKPAENVRRDQMASFITTTLELLVDDGDQPPIATVTAAPANVPKGTALTVTVTGVRGNLASITASGCGAAAKTTTAPAGTTPDTLTVALDIPTSQANGDCDITVDTEFADVDDFGGQDRERTDVRTVTVVSAT